MAEVKTLTINGVTYTIADTSVRSSLDNKQDKLTAGANITIDENNVISATGGGGTPASAFSQLVGSPYDNTNLSTALNSKQATLTAGSGINIDENNVISSTSSSTTWGNINGTISNQTDLVQEFDKKQDKISSENAGNGISISTSTIVPDDYIELEYIESHGEQFIDTGVKGSNATEVKIIAECNNTTNYLFGSKKDDNDKSFSFCIADAHTKFQDEYATNENKYADFEAGRYKIFKTANVTTIDGEEVGNYTITPFNNNLNIYLFGVNFDGGIRELSSTKIYYFEANDGTTHVELIPVQRISDSAIGFYDTISGTFFENQGNDSFTGGPIVYTNLKISAKSDSSKQDKLTSENAGTGISITNDASGKPIISNTLTSAEWGNITGDIYDQEDLQEEFDLKQDKLVAGTGIIINETESLPVGYTQIEYVESNGTQFIDTGIKYNTFDNVNIKYQILNPQYNLYGYVFGVKDVTMSPPNVEDSHCFLTTSDLQNMLSIGGCCSSQFQFGTIDADIHTFKLDGTKPYFDGLRINSSGTYISFWRPDDVVESKANVALFGLYKNTSSTPSNYESINGVLPVRIYSFEIEGKCRLIPAKNSEGVVGFYDTIRRTFITTTKGDAFTAGSDVLRTISAKQDKLIAGANITIDGNVISAASNFEKGDGINVEVPSVILPEGYTLLKYIENTGSQYIDTGIPYVNTDYVYAKYSIGDLSYSSSTDNYFLGIFDQPNSSVHFCISKFQNSGMYFRQGKSQYSYGTGIIANTWYEVEQNANVLTINGEYKNTFTEVDEATSLANMLLFGVKQNTDQDPTSWNISIYPISKLRIAEYIHKDKNGVEKRHMYPAKNTNGVAGMYDMVTNTFYVSEGSNPFVAGEEFVKTKISAYIDGSNGINVNYPYTIPSEYQEIEYIENNSGAVCKTSSTYLLSDSIELSCKTRAATGSENGYILSSRAGSFYNDIRYYSSSNWYYLYANMYNGSGIGEKELKKWSTSQNVDNVVEVFKTNDSTVTYYTDKKKAFDLPLSLNSCSYIYLFAKSLGYGSYTASDFNMRIYYLIHKNSSGKVKTHLRPVKRISDNKIGFYDLVSGDFLPSITSIEFVGGDIVKHDNIVNVENNFYSNTDELTINNGKFTVDLTNYYKTNTTLLLKNKDGAGVQTFFDSRASGTHTEQAQTVIGGGASSGNQYATVYGCSAKASASHTTAIGFTAQTVGAYATALGCYAYASGSYAISIGGCNSTSYKTSATGSYSIAMGFNARTTSQHAIAIGYTTGLYAGDYSTLIGSFAHSSNGKGGYVTGLGYNVGAENYGVSIGHNASCHTNGNKTTGYNVVVGSSSTCAGYSVVVGYNTAAYDNNSVSIGSGSKTDAEGAIAIGCSAVANNGSTDSIAIGNHTTISGSNNVKIGTKAIKNGNYNVGIGNNCWVIGDKSIAIGYGANIGSSETSDVQNSIQLGEGTLNADNKFNVWSYELLDKTTGKIPSSRLPEGSGLPSQSGQSGKYLTTNGTSASWANVDSLPSQSGNDGKFLTTNGTSASWAEVTKPTYIASTKTIEF